MVTCAVIMGMSVAYLAYIRFRYTCGAQALRRMMYWYLAGLVVIATIARWSEVTETRCRRDPMEFCRYNDGVPVMAVIVIVFFVAGVVRARLAYANR